MPKYQIADTVFDAKVKYPYTLNLCSDYLYLGDKTAEFSVEITDEDIKREKEISEKYETLPTFPDPYLESLALFRKLNDYILTNKNGVVFHSSAISLDGDGYLFIGKSGAGKSTHARLYKECFLDRVTIINDDKPIIKKTDDGFMVYGTPFCGKHKIGENTSAKIKGVCEIVQSKVTKVEVLSKTQAVAVLLNQVVRQSDRKKAEKLLDLIEDLAKSVKVIRLYCDSSYSAVKTGLDAFNKE